MARYETHKDTPEGKRQTITRRTARTLKYRAPVQDPQQDYDAALVLLARELGAVIVK